MGQPLRLPIPGNDKIRTLPKIQGGRAVQGCIAIARAMKRSENRAFASRKGKLQGWNFPALKKETLKNPSFSR